MKKESKTAEWNRVRRQLVIEFALMGVTRCEFNRKGCWRTNGLSFAHAVKRHAIRSDAPEGDPTNLRSVAIACLICHQELERLPKEDMRAAVMRVIEARKDRQEPERACWEVMDYGRRMRGP